MQGGRKVLMKTKLMALALLAGGAMFAQPRVSIGIGIGGGQRAYGPAYGAQPVRPPCPGPGYVWTDGYWSQYGGRHLCVAGFLEQPSYGNAYGNRYDDRRDWNRDRERDRYREEDRNSDHGRSFGQDRQGNSFSN